MIRNQTVIISYVEQGVQELASTPCDYTLNILKPHSYTCKISKVRKIIAFSGS